VRRVADGGARDVDLVVGLQIHEDEVLTVGVEVLHRALVHGRRVDLGAGVEGPVHTLAGEHILQRGPHERATLARLDMQALHDGPQLAVELENHAVLQIVRGGHERCDISPDGDRTTVARWITNPMESTRPRRRPDRLTPPRRRAMVVPAGPGTPVTGFARVTAYAGRRGGAGPAGSRPHRGHRSLRWRPRRSPSGAGTPPGRGCWRCAPRPAGRAAWRRRPVRRRSSATRRPG